MHFVLVVFQTTMNDDSHNVLLLYYNPTQASVQNTVGVWVMGEERVWGTGRKFPSGVQG